MILEFLVILAVMAGLFVVLAKGLMQARRKELEVVPINDQRMRGTRGANKRLQR